MKTSEILENLQRDAKSGELNKASIEKLEEYASALCHSQAFSVFGSHEFPQISESVRIQLLRAHIENLQKYVIGLQNHITSLNTKNSKLQKWVIFLAIAALISTGVQTSIAVLEYKNRKVAPRRFMWI